MVSADRQSAGDETIWQQEGAGQGTYTSENGRTLGHSSMQLVQVSENILLLCKLCTGTEITGFQIQIKDYYR